MSFRAALLLASGCAALPPAPPPPTAPAAVPDAALWGIPGETMAYDIRLRGLRVARVDVAVGQLGWIDGHRALIVRSRGTTTGLLSLVTDVTYELTTTLDLDAGHPIVDDERARIVVEGNAESSHHERLWSARDIAVGVHDLHSAAAALRGWRGGARVRLIDVEIDDNSIDVALAESRRELVKTMPAVRYDGRVRDRFPFTVWISDDAARVPLAVHAGSKWGDIDVTLVDYEAP